MPIGSLASVEVVERNGRSGQRGRKGKSDSVLTLRKKDGGVLELCVFKSAQEGRALEALLREAIAEEKPSSGEADPVSQLSAFPSIAALRVGETLEIGWSSAASPSSFLALGPLAGMGVIVYGFHQHEPSAGTLLMLAFVGLLSLLLVASAAWSFGTRQRVRLDARDVTLERLRFGRVEKTTHLPLVSVAAVDYTHQLSVKGGALTLRTSKAPPSLSVPSDMTDPEAALDLGRQVFALATSGHALPLGDLSLAAKIALDLALSAEIERRNRSSVGEV